MSRYDDDDERPRRRKRRDEEEDSPPRRAKPMPKAKRAKVRRRSSARNPLPMILGLVVGLIVLSCAGIFGYGYFKYDKIKDEGMEREASAQTLKQIGMACLQYENNNQGFPTDTAMLDGRPLLSWRVHLLPFLGEQNLHAQFRLDEPWDSPTNRPLLNRMPKIYGTPTQKSGKEPLGSVTFYRGFTSPGCVFAPRMGRQGGNFSTPQRPIGPGFGWFQDGMAETVIAVESGTPVEWTRPDDLDTSLGRAFPEFGGIRPKSPTFLALFANGSVQSIRRTNNEARWRAAISYAGNDRTELD